MRTLLEGENWLRERGIDVERTDWGLRGTWADATRRYEYRLGLNFDSGYETSVRPEPGRATWWIHAQTMDEMLNMLVDAQADVDAGRAPTWLDALRAMDPIRWMDPDYKEPK